LPIGIGSFYGKPRNIDGLLPVDLTFGCLFEKK